MPAQSDARVPRRLRGGTANGRSTAFGCRGRLSPILLFLQLVLATAYTLGLPTHAQYQIPISVLGGGGRPIADDTLFLNGTVGQAAIGVVTDTTYVNEVGFWYLATASSASAVDEGSPARGNYQLGRNFPNPSHPRTMIPFSIPERAQVALRVFDVSGRVVATLVDGRLDPGEYTVVLNADRLESGIYFYQLKAPAFSQTRRLILVK